MRTAFLLAALLASGPALAQDRGQFVSAVSGEWYVFDTAARAADAPCRFTLAATPAGESGRMAVTPAGCAAGLAGIAAWDIEGAQLVFYDAAGGRFAELGGTQQRMTGVRLAEGDGLIFERPGGDANTAALAQAIQRHRCFYTGYGPTCAEPADLARPLAAEGQDRVELLVELAVRGQPRRDSAVIGTVPRGVCIQVEQCLNASDGLWCRARFGETVGWLSKSALRQSEWPVVTYRTGCRTGADG